MKQTLIIAAVLGGVNLLLTSKRSGGQPTPTAPPTRREYADRLANRLQNALSYGHKPLWDETSEECRRIGREDLPGRMREKFPDWAERLDLA